MSRPSMPIAPTAVRDALFDDLYAPGQGIQKPTVSFADLAMLPRDREARILALEQIVAEFDKSWEKQNTAIDEMRATVVACRETNKRLNERISALQVRCEAQGRVSQVMRAYTNTRNVMRYSV